MNDPQQLLEQIFSHYNDFNAAEVQGSKSRMNESYGDAVAKSCLFFRQIEGVIIDRVIEGTLNPDYKVLRDLKQNPELLKRFLQTERKIFSKSDMSPSVSDGLENIIRQLIDTDLSGEFSQEEFISKTKWLQEQICQEASAKSKKQRKKSFLKNVVYGVSGATIALLNISPPIVITVAMTGFSVGTGAYLMEKAADGFLGDKE